MKELTKAEEQVMQVLWQIKQGFAADIIANFPEPKPAYIRAIRRTLRSFSAPRPETRPESVCLSEPLS